MSGEAWGTVQDGFAKGPDVVIWTERGDAVTCSALWTAEDGVQVSIGIGDEVLNCAEARALSLALERLAALPAPEGASLI